MVNPVKIPWYGDSEYAKRIINEMNQTSFKDTDLKAKLFTKTVGKGLLECEEYYIVITRGDDHEWWIQYFDWRSNEDNSQSREFITNAIQQGTFSGSVYALGKRRNVHIPRKAFEDYMNHFNKSPSEELIIALLNSLNEKSALIKDTQHNQPNYK